MGNNKGVITKKLFKEAYKQGKSLRQSMLDAGLAESTANHGRACVMAREAEKEIQREFNRSQITVDYVLKGIVNLMENPSTKSSDKVQCFNLLGKYLKLFTDTPQVQVAIFDKYSQDLPPLVVEQPVDKSATLDVSSTNDTQAPTT